MLVITVFLLTLLASGDQPGMLGSLVLKFIGTENTVKRPTVKYKFNLSLFKSFPA